MPSSHLAASVTAAVNAWLWVPSDAEVIDTPDLLLINWPSYFKSPPSLMRFTPRGDVETSFAEASEATRAWGHSSIIAWVKLNAPEGFEEFLTARGRPDETVDVFALELDPLAPSLAQERVDVRWVDNLATMRDFYRVSAGAFGQGEVPDEETLTRETTEAVSDYQAGRGGYVLGYLPADETTSGPDAAADTLPAVGASGLGVVDHVARLWGGGVLPHARRQGVYRAMVGARLAYATKQGANLAIVKGRIETSGPILRRLGFDVFGQERSYVVPLGSA